MHLKKTKVIIEGKKRQYFPYVLVYECKNCGAKTETNFEYDYLSYPVFGEKKSFILYCSECEEESEKIFLLPELKLSIVQ